MENILIVLALIVLLSFAVTVALRCLLWLSDSFDDMVQDVFEKIARR